MRAFPTRIGTGKGIPLRRTLVPSKSPLVGPVGSDKTIGVVRNRIFTVISVVGICVLFWAFWLLPRGEGEYRDSPDGLWRGHVSRLSRGTLLGSRRRYVELSVERLADGFTIWRQQIPFTSVDTVPAYGRRDSRFISWSTDSSQFVVSTTNGAMLTVPITVARKGQTDRLPTNSPLSRPGFRR